MVAHFNIAFFLLQYIIKKKDIEWFVPSNGWMKSERELLMCKYYLIKMYTTCYLDT